MRGEINGGKGVDGRADGVRSLYSWGWRGGVAAGISIPIARLEMDWLQVQEGKLVFRLRCWCAIGGCEYWILIGA